MTRHLAGRVKGPATVFALLAMAFVSACSGSSGSPAATKSTAPAPSGQQAPTASVAGQQQSAKLQALYKGTLKSPSTASRPAVKGKKIVIISAGQSSISSSVPVNAAEAAAKAIGWQVSVYDEQLNPANAPGLMRQAISSGADGIILDATDCPTVKGPLQEAKARGVVVVGIYSFDCNDPAFGAGGKPLFTGNIDYGVATGRAIDKFTESYGAAQADAMIAATGGKAQVIYFNDPEFVVLKQKAATALLQHPEANAVKSPYTAATILGIAPAVAQSGRVGQIYVMGGEGFQPELDLMRAHQGVNGAMIAPSDWTGFASIDTMNSLFRHQKPAYSGLGWQLVDATHNLPASGPFVSSINYKAIYEKAWGVGQ